MNPMSQIRTLTESDAPLYRELRLRALQLNPESFVTTYEEYMSRSTEQTALQLSPSSDHFTLGMLTTDSNLVGTVTFTQQTREKMRHIGSVQGMFVAPEERARGIGRRMLEALIHKVRERPHLEQLRLTVVEGNVAAQRLYKSVGFDLIGRDPLVLKVGDAYFAELQMVLPLKGKPKNFHDVEQPTQNGFSHVTIDVSNLARSLEFYVDILGMQLVHRGQRDAYLEWGHAWICLQERPDLPMPTSQLGVNHVALYTQEREFHTIVQTLREKHVQIVREPQLRGGGQTINFLDPDGTQLEFHTGTLHGRMKEWT